MSYQKKNDHDVEREWRRWLQERSHELAELGIPLALYSQRTAWNDFVSRGLAAYTANGLGRELDFNTLSLEHQKRLLEFLEREMGSREAPAGLLRFLRVRAAHGWVPPFS